MKSTKLRKRTQHAAAGLLLAFLSQNSLMTVHADEQWNWNGENWTYVKEDGSLARDEWKKIDGSWYVFDKEGNMKTGWHQEKSGWYLLGQNGAMIKDSWAYKDGCWYFFSPSGVMQTGWLAKSDSTYYLKRSGAMACDQWAYIDGKWFYFDKTGAMQTGWIEWKGKRYYLNEDGEMVSGIVPVEDILYWFADSGELLEDKDLASIRTELARQLKELQASQNKLPYSLEYMKSMQSIAFYEWLGWEDVQDWMNLEDYGGLSTSTDGYKRFGLLLGSYSNPASCGDAFSLENMKASLEQLKIFNETYRTGLNNLPALEVSSYMMFAAQLNANYSIEHYEHGKAFALGENLYCSYLTSGFNPWAGWYEKEKQLYEDGEDGSKDESKVGHYFNIISRNPLDGTYLGYTCTGYAISRKEGSTYAQCHCQLFSANPYWEKYEEYSQKAAWYASKGDTANARLFEEAAAKMAERTANQAPAALEEYASWFDEYYSMYQQAKQNQQRIAEIQSMLDM